MNFYAEIHSNPLANDVTPKTMRYKIIDNICLLKTLYLLKAEQGTHHRVCEDKHETS